MTTIRDIEKAEPGMPPIKACPTCYVVSVASVKHCQHCGYQFYSKRRTNTERKEVDLALKRWGEDHCGRTEEEEEALSSSMLSAMEDELMKRF